MKRTFAADYIFPIIGTPIKEGYVTIGEKGEILETGKCKDRFPDSKISENPSFGTENEKISYHEGIICPGFVNAHCHIELSHLKGKFSEASGMSGFINQINALRLTSGKEERIEALKNQMELLYDSGVSGMGDISNCDESFKTKTESGIFTRTYIELFGTESNDAGEILAKGIELANEAVSMGLKAAVTPHSCYTMSPGLLEITAEKGLESGYISYHSQESRQENDMIMYGKGDLADNYRERGLSMPPITGKSALIYFTDRLLSFSGSPVKGHIMLVHNVDTDKGSIEYALTNMATPYWTICPLSNIFIHRKLPPLDLMRKYGLKICIGTDSLSSNKILSMVEEMKCIQNNFDGIPMQEILRWACLNGAEAIGADKFLGSFDKGKTPGITHISHITAKRTGSPQNIMLELNNNSISERLA
ncbi:MAG: amidohydrolase family protein [Bacteroidales bacterium]|nr:amidohydrolase family protein [Bacteroidales bacterium]